LNEVANLLIISRCVLSELALIVVFWLGASGHPIGAYVYIYIYIYNLSLSLSLSLYIYILSLSIYIYIYIYVYIQKQDWREPVYKHARNEVEQSDV